MRVYVAGASAELERARAAMDWVRETPCLTLSHDWVADVVKHRVEGGRSDADLSDSERRDLAGADLEAVANCDVFWLLVPDGCVTVGAWVELGAALAAGRLVVATGMRVQEHLFCGLASYTRLADLNAKDIIARLSRG